MKLFFLYILPGIFISAGCLIARFSENLYSISVLPISIAGAITGFHAMSLRQKNKLKRRKSIIINIVIVLLFLLLVICLTRVPEETLIRVYRSWYFLGSFWLIMVCALVYRYQQEKKAQHQKFTPDR